MIISKIKLEAPHIYQLIKNSLIGNGGVPDEDGDAVGGIVRDAERIGSIFWPCCNTCLGKLALDFNFIYFHAGNVIVLEILLEIAPGNIVDTLEVLHHHHYGENDDSDD